MNLLNPLEIDLTGTTLIEASAGTGKTYTITTLFLRLLIEKKVPIDQILVVTFTIAATEELRIKLANRLNLANLWLRSEEKIDANQDPSLAELLDGVDSQQALTLVGDAVARLDDLSVYTIDAMCLRILKDYAFESGLPMRIEMIADDTEVRLECARDYWRHVIGNGSAFDADNLLAFAKSPVELLDKINDALRLRDAEIIPHYDSAHVELLADQLKQQYSDIVECWKNNSRRIREVFDDQGEALKGGSYKPDSKARVIEWLKSLGDRLPEFIPSRVSFKLLTADWMQRQTKKGAVTPAHAFFDLCNGFEERFKEYKKWQKIAAIVPAREFLQQQINEYKSDRGMIHFEDMRTRLDRALQQEHGGVLAEKIRQLWPYALIDEFQDTDAEQFRIFNTVYDQQPDCGFFMIGDPKQAVYSFRGADVFTYMRAVGQAQNQYTLGTNWRSTPRMVQSVNCLFSSREDAFVFDQIPFHVVQSAPVNETNELQRAGQRAAPLTINLFDKDEFGKEDIAVACASDIARLLQEGASAAATIAGCKRNIRRYCGVGAVA